MANQRAGQVIVCIPEDMKLLEGLILPGYIKTLMKHNSTNFKVVDSRGREFNLSIEACGYNRVKITRFGDWEKFVTTSLGDNISKICFKCLALNTFEAICFDLDGIEMYVSPIRIQLVKRCVIEADGQTEAREYLPTKFLVPYLRVEKKLKPIQTASIFGPRQHEDVNVIWEYDAEMERFEDKDRKGGWFGVGFEGSRWTNLCYQNDVQPGHIMMFEYIIEGKCFTLDVFNEDGVGLGVTAIAYYVDSEKRMKVSYAELEDVPDVIELPKHSCRISNHKCKVDCRDVLIMKFEHHSQTTHHLTLPGEFVRYWRINTYKQCVFKFGTMKFDMRLDIRPDARRLGDNNHVVCVYDWEKFSKATGIMFGEWIKLEVVLMKTEPGKFIYFSIC